MSRHSTHFEGSGGGLVLTSAILLYGNRSAGGHAVRRSGNEASAFASIHAVDQDGDGVPTIAAGRPLSRANLRQWTELLRRTAKPEILPANILVAHSDMLVWWVPEQVRAAYFALTSPPAGLSTLAERVTVRVPYPAHLFVATRHGLGVYALGSNERPTAETQLLHSPILNVYVDGQLCWGNIARPRALTITSLPEFERAVFESWSTHPNPGQDLTITGKSGIERLWDELARRGATRFPVKRLKPFGSAGRRRARSAPQSGSSGSMTLGQLIAASARS